MKKSISIIFWLYFGISILLAQKELQKGKAFYERKQYDSAAYYYKKGYRIATLNRDLNTQKKYIPLIIQAEMYAQDSPDSALKYANLMYFADFPLYVIYEMKENIFRRFLYYDSTALYAAKYSSTAPKSDNKTQIERLKNAVLAYYEAYYYDLALFYSNQLLILCETEYSKQSLQYAEIKLIIAVILAKKGEFAMAQSTIQQAILIYKKYPEKPTLMAYAEYANSLILTQIGRYVQGLNAIQKAIAIYKKELGENHVSTAKAFLQLGILYEKTALYDSALYYQQKAYTLFKNLLPEDNLYLAQVFQAMGKTYYTQKKYDKAEEYYQKALFIQKQHYIQYHPKIAETYKNLGNVMEAKKNAVLTYRFYELAMNICTRTLGKQHIETAQSYINLGTAYFLKKEFKKSLDFYLKGTHILEHNPDLAIHEYLFYAYYKLARYYESQKDYLNAIQYAEKSIYIAKNTLDRCSPYMAEQYLYLADLYQNAQQRYNQIQAYQKAIDALSIKPVSEPYATPIYKDIILEEKAIPLLIQKAQLILKRYTYQPLRPVTLWANENTKTVSNENRQEYELNSALNALELVLELKHKAFKQGKILPVPQEVEQNILFLCLYLYQISQQQHYIEKLLSYTEVFAYQKQYYPFFLNKKSLPIQDTLIQRKTKIENQLADIQNQLLNTSLNEYKADTHLIKKLVYQYTILQKERENIWQNIQKYAPEYYNNFTLKGLNTNTSFQTKTDKFISFLSLDGLSKTWETVKNEQHPLYKAQILYYLPLPDSKSVVMILERDKMHCIPLETTQETYTNIRILDSLFQQGNTLIPSELLTTLSQALFEPIKSYLNAQTLIVFTHGIFDKLSIENLIIDKKNTVISKYKVFYTYSLINLLNQAVEQPKTEFTYNVFYTKHSIPALSNPKCKFVPLSYPTQQKVDILHTDSFIEYPEICYLYVSAYYGNANFYFPFNHIIFRYPIDIQIEQQFWDTFYENLMKKNTIGNAFYLAQQKIQKQNTYYVGHFRLYVAKI